MKIAKGSHLPSADFVGNYYFVRQGSPISDVSWDLGLSATLPIFSWGSIQSQVRAAASDLRTKELLRSRLFGQARQEVSTFYLALEADLKQIGKLERATTLSNRNVQLLKRDFERGLATNLEVLQAIDADQQNHRMLDRVRYTSKLDYLKLEASVISRPEDLGVIGDEL